MRARYVLAALLSHLVSMAVVATPEEQACIDGKPLIEEKLACLDGLSATEVFDTRDIPAAIRVFELRYQQPINHENAATGWFPQRLVLLHRAEAEPMVLQTSGYAIFGIRQATVTATFQTNQLQVEHRFFATSRPDPLDWSHLNIKQSADDFHRITVAFRQIYGRRWLNTGGSKGGMTSIYHRRFYPDDVDGTLADVAPLSFGTEDDRYVAFMDQVGGARYESCRQKWRTMQRTLLEQREEILPRIRGSFAQLGSADVAFEHDVIEAHFLFWQYLRPEDPEVGCAKIPTSDNVSDLWAYLQKVNPVSDYEDQNLLAFHPYFFQAATQLGAPALGTGHVDDVRRYEFSIDQYVPRGEAHAYDPSAMTDVKAWFESSAHNVMLVYGEFDPWSAGAFPEPGQGRDAHKFVVRAGNHGAKFTALEASQRDEAFRRLSTWLDKDVPSASLQERIPVGGALEDLEHAYRARHRLL